MFDALRKKFSSIVKKTEKNIKKTVKSVKKSISKPEKKHKKEAKQVKKSKKSKKLDAKIEQQPKVEIIKESAEEIVEEVEIEEEESAEKDEEKEESSFGFFSKLKGYLSTSKLTEEQFNDAFEDMEITLLENNVALEAVDAIKKKLSEELVNQQVKKDNIDDKIVQSLKDAILSVIKEPEDLLQKIKSKDGVFVMLFFGINGTGKTTSIAKLAQYLKSNGISSVMAAADTFRAAAIEQLKTHADRLNVPIVAASYNADPASVAFDAIQYAKKHSIKVVLIDTAGRMYTQENLMREMEKIVRVASPDMKIFVGESITGNDAIDQARTFNDAVNIDGVILTKADVDEKAGTILSVSHVTGKPILFLGTGQSYSDLTPFTKKAVLKNLGLD